MEYLVVAEVEIDGSKVEHYTNITLRQKFNAHHEFTIRISHDVLENSGSFSPDKAQKKIGKPALIVLKKLNVSSELVYEFRGIICEVRMEQSGTSDADLVLVGYSPTIIIENGPNLTSFYKSDLKKIVGQLTKDLSQSNCTVNVSPQYSKQITYITQYRESSFHFLNRLSDNFSEFFFYNGKELFFGKPSSFPSVDVVYGEDITSMQLTLQALPVSFTNYGYISKENKTELYEAPANVDGLGQYASYVLKESSNLFPGPVNQPVRQRIENKSDLENFVKKKKAALAANLEMLTGTSFNPSISIGTVINVKVSKLKNMSFVKEDYGKFLVIGVEHHISDNAKYYNSFEAIPADVEVLPESHAIQPLAETQVAIVKDNKDPDNMGRIRVQMLWQKGNEMTDWLRVMTPDAGGAKNRGYVFIPEKDDQVLISFRYNDPDRPFILGSVFHGKTAGGGGDNNKSKTITTRSGVAVSIDDAKGSIVVADAKGNSMNIDGAGNISIHSSAKIAISTGKSSITLKSDGTIDIIGKDITIGGENIAIGASKDAKMASGGASFEANGQGNEAKVDGMKVSITGGAETSVHGGAKNTVSAGGKVAIQGAIVALN